MRIIFTAGVALALAASNALADEASCKGDSKEINGNWYCSAVDELKYDIFGQKGTYMRVTHMDPDTGECTQEPQEYSGPMAPFNEEVRRAPASGYRVGGHKTNADMMITDIIPLPWSAQAKAVRGI